MTKELIRTHAQRIKSLLPEGAISQIARECGLRRQSVSRILAGSWYNPEVIARALELIEERGKEAKELVEALKEGV